MNRFFGKVSMMLLAAMLFFTFVSRVADSFLVTRVAVGTPSAKKIEHTVRAVGSVEKGVEFPVLTEAGCLVETVFVREGEWVEEGQLLAQVHTGRLAEQVEAMREEIASLKLQNDAILQNAVQQKEARARQIERADEDYKRAVEEKERAVREAANALASAENALAHNSPETAADAKESLWIAYFTAQRALEAAERDGGKNVEAARRAVEDANVAQQADASAEMGRISIAQKEHALSGYEALFAAEGKIFAPQSGVITAAFVQTGQNTPETAAFAMAADGGVVRITAEISTLDAAHLAVGDAVAVEKDGKTYEGFSVASLSQTADGAVTLAVSGEGAPEVFRMGDGAQVTVKKQSKLYGTAVPRSAVYTEQGKQYVYVLDERSTVLGNQFFARKVEVVILDKNESFAAIQEGSLGTADRIVTAADRYVQSGDRVRLMEP